MRKRFVLVVALDTRGPILSLSPSCALYIFYCWYNFPTFSPFGAVPVINVFLVQFVGIYHGIGEWSAEDHLPNCTCGREGGGGGGEREILGQIFR